MSANHLAEPKGSPQAFAATGKQPRTGVDFIPPLNAQIKVTGALQSTQATGMSLALAGLRSLPELPTSFDWRSKADISKRFNGQAHMAKFIVDVGDQVMRLVLGIQQRRFYERPLGDREDVIGRRGALSLCRRCRSSARRRPMIKDRTVVTAGAVAGAMAKALQITP